MITTPAYFVQLDFSTVLRLSSRGDQTYNGYTWTGGRLGKVQISNLSLKPEVTIKTLEENTEWLKEMN